MFFNLYKKDCLLLVKELKFQIFFSILIILFIVGAFSNSIKYKADLDKYNNKYKVLQNSAAERSKNLSWMIAKANVTYMRMPLSSMVIQRDESYPVGFSSGLTYRQVETIRNYDDYKQRINWFFIIGFICSFSALIFSYNVISEEKNNSTLRLLIISGYSRYKILMSKYASLLSLFFVTIMAGQILSLLIWTFLNKGITSTLITESIIWSLVSIIYISFFILLGILISMAKNANSAVVKALVCWLLFIVIIPKTAVLVGNQITKVDSIGAYLTRMNEAFNAEFNRWMDKYDDNEKNEHYVGGNMYVEKGLRAGAVSSAMTLKSDEWEKYLRDSEAQTETILKLSMLSPYELLRRIGNSILDIGFLRYKNEKKQFYNKLDEVSELAKKQDAEDENSLHQFYNWAWSDGRNAFTTEPFKNPEKLVSSDYMNSDVSYRMNNAVKPFVLLILYNLLIFAVSLFVLRKYDVR